MLRQFFRSIDLWQLFLTVVFPTHLWALFRVFMNGDWIAAREGAWEVLGLGSYSLLYTLVESLLLLIALTVLSALLPSRWTREHRTATMQALFLTATVWAIISQLYFLLEIGDQGLLFRIFFNLNRFGAIILPLLILGVAFTVALPVYLSYRSEKFTALVQDLGQRISLLSGLYLVLDAVALIVVILRNL